jgi:hypothetical protein
MLFPSTYQRGWMPCLPVLNALARVASVIGAKMAHWVSTFARVVEDTGSSTMANHCPLLNLPSCRRGWRHNEAIDSDCWPLADGGRLSGLLGQRSHESGPGMGIRAGAHGPGVALWNDGAIGVLLRGMPLGGRGYILKFSNANLLTGFCAIRRGPHLPLFFQRAQSDQADALHSIERRRPAKPISRHSENNAATAGSR